MGAEASNNFMNELNSATATLANERRISVRPKTRTVNGDDVPICAAAISKTFTIDPDDVVEELPRHSRTTTSRSGSSAPSS